MDPPAPFHPTATRRIRKTVRVGVGVIVVMMNYQKHSTCCHDHDDDDDTNASRHDESNNNNKNNNKEPPTVSILAGIRKGSHGSGMLALPGGHLDMYETWIDCAKREVKEETALDIDNVQYIHVTNDIMVDDEKHYVTIFMAGKVVNRAKQNDANYNNDPNNNNYYNNVKPINMEPNKCAGWDAYTLDELKSMLSDQHHRKEEEEEDRTSNKNDDNNNVCTDKHTTRISSTDAPSTVVVEDDDDDENELQKQQRIEERRSSRRGRSFQLFGPLKQLIQDEPEALTRYLQDCYNESLHHDEKGGDVIQE